MELKEEIAQSLNLKIERVADLFYKQNSQEGYLEFVELIDDINELLRVFESTGIQDDCKQMNLKLQNSLTEAMEAMTNKDNVLLADILMYDMKDLLNGILEKI